MKRSLMLLSLTGILALTFVGCASYYKVVDPASGRTYYTDHIDNKGGGAIAFKDEATKTRVTLGASEVMEITEDQFKANIHPR